MWYALAREDVRGITESVAAPWSGGLQPKRKSRVNTADTRPLLNQATLCFP